MDSIREIRLSHIGVLVHRIDTAGSLYQRLGLPEVRRETFPQEDIRMAFVPVEEVRIELMEPLAPTGPLPRFLAIRGEGIHHLAFEVPNIEQALAASTPRWRIERELAGRAWIVELPPSAFRGLWVFTHPPGRRDTQDGGWPAGG